MDFEDFVAQINDDGKRIDKILRILIPKASLSEIYRLLRKNFIKVNGKKIKEDYRVCTNDKISIPQFALNQNKEDLFSSQNNQTNQPNQPQPNQANQQNQPNQVNKINQIEQINQHFFNENFHPVFENEHILILNKPYNLNVHNDSHSLDAIVQDYFHDTRENNSLSFKPGPLHRLDKKTTGLVAFSMSIQGARWFCKNIENHRIQKIYYAVLEGKIENPEHWDDFIENNHENQNNFYKVSAFSENQMKNQKKSSNAKNASMQVFPLDYGKFNGKNVTFAKIILKTGRKHQIRSQSALHNFPLLGDSVYGSKQNLQKKGFKQDFFLQAAELIIPQNPIELPAQIKIPLNDEFIFLLKSCDIQKTDI